MRSLIERTYTKDEILELYFIKTASTLAHGNVGVEAAARYYFNKSPAKLNSGRSGLAGRDNPVSPESVLPFYKHPEVAKSR